MFLTFIFVVIFSMEKEPHKFSESECPSCHAVDASGRLRTDQLTAPAALLCERCHRSIYEDAYMHPINVIPLKVTVPADLPLSPSGQLTCSTCHDIHSAYFTPYGASSHFLRRLETGQAFCNVCHRSSLSSGRGHAQSMGEAHFSSKYKEMGFSEAIDPLSSNCVSCHDGTYASSVQITAGAWSHRRELMHNDTGSHPIGVDYESARVTPGRRTYLKPIIAVDQRIRFFDGKVGCGSCHDPFSDIEKRLVMSDAGSKLCLSCHMMGR